MNDRRGRLAAAANAALAELGRTPRAGQFVCPICLHLRPQEKATAAHYPAKSMPGPHVTTLACEACNALTGGTYEPEAVDWLRGIWTIAWGFDKKRQLTARGTVEKEGHRVTLKMGGPLDRRPRRRRGRFPETLSAIRAQAREPNVAHMEIRQPNAASVQRALLAWAFLTWSHYARYAYTASAGAALVRRPNTPLPDGLFVAYQPLTGLVRPDPIVVVCTNSATISAVEEVQEFIGLGVEWGNGFSVLPFADDIDGACWRRTAALLARSPHPYFGRWSIREWMADGSFRHQLRDELVIKGEGVRYAITHRPDATGAILLAKGQSPHRLEPSRGTWQPSQVVEHEFSVPAHPEFRLRRPDGD